VTPYQPLTVRARPGSLLINSLFLKSPESARCPFFFYSFSGRFARSLGLFGVLTLVVRRGSQDAGV
jgi:hypothetical protein